jgi:hypothetical protein
MSSLSNISVWATPGGARRMNGVQPALELGRVFAELGATFERPIMNYDTLWALNPGG